jgi:hypothetical protein
MLFEFFRGVDGAEYLVPEFVAGLDLPPDLEEPVALTDPALAVTRRAGDNFVT